MLGSDDRCLARVSQSSAPGLGLRRRGGSHVHQEALLFGGSSALPSSAVAPRRRCSALGAQLRREGSGAKSRRQASRKRQGHQAAEPHPPGLRRAARPTVRRTQAPLKLHDVLSVLCALRWPDARRSPCPTGGLLSRPRRRPRGLQFSLRLLRLSRSWRGQRHLQDTESLGVTILWQGAHRRPHAETALLGQGDLCWTGPRRCPSWRPQTAGPCSQTGVIPGHSWPGLDLPVSWASRVLLPRLLLETRTAKIRQ